MDRASSILCLRPIFGKRKTKPFIPRHVDDIEKVRRFRAISKMIRQNAHRRAFGF